MVVDREKFLVLAAALAAVPLGVGRADAAAGAASPAGPGSAAGASNDFCDDVKRQNDLLLTQPSGWCEGHGAEMESLRAEVARQRQEAPFFHYCHHGKGTWAVLLVSVGIEGPGGESGSCGWGASYELVFQPTVATPLRDCPVSKPREWGASPDETYEVIQELAFDYNGDGKDELILAQDRWGNGEGTSRSVEVFRGDGDHERVVPYDVGFRYDGVVDADGDGRPDLLAGAYFTATTECGLGSHDHNGVPLLVHSLADGTFSMSDEVSRRWAIAECPSPGRSSRASPSCEASASCQRVWGRSEAEMNAWALREPACAEGIQCLGGRTVAPAFAAVKLPWPPLGVSTPTPLAPAKVIVEPPERD